MASCDLMKQAATVVAVEGDDGNHKYPMQSFHQWVENHVQEVPDATTLALLISQAGDEGLTLDDLRRKTRLDLDILDCFLAGLLTTGQVARSKVRGRLVYRAGM